MVGIMMISWMVVPFTILIVLMTISSSIGQFWPWLVGAAVYGIVGGLVVSRLRDSVLEALLITLLTVAPIGYVLTHVPWGWFAGTAALLVGLLGFSTSASMCGMKSVRNAAMLAGVQMMWVAPSALVFWYYAQGDMAHSLYALITALVAAIGAFYVAEDM